MTDKQHQDKQTHGGIRKGAGRIPKNGPTKAIAIRVPTADLEILSQKGVDNISGFYVEAGKKAIKRLKK